MQAVIAVLPELDALGDDEEAAPAIGHGQLGLGVVGGELLDPVLERPRLGTTWLWGEAIALSWLPRGTRAHVLRRALARCALDGALDADLAPEHAPSRRAAPPRGLASSSTPLRLS